ncbi:Transglutaminase-like enzyme, putative cysteine protease [Hyunsoonleella jejuensis]|uniref:Transglutaminase-like enzyme, putative cysteine protease n=1 Tax=Hyunsoonleella jejuensis TaxID=419940 RepID=A0A1H9CMM1_9FLAO|nr:transglutaminase family protein [Hyunsoonleella jejuensis]SEQ02419.1 Transglutaminase-like enzyme, putative cysteine protease [Hyunsoonleella jejuensis]
MPLYYIKHITKYSYSGNVFDGANQIRLYPFNNEFQKIVSQRVLINGNPNVHLYQDFYHNFVGSFMMVEPHNFLSIESDVEVITNPVVFPEDSATPEEQWQFLKTLKNDTQFIDYLKYITFDGTPEIFEMIKEKDLSTISPYKVALEFCDFIYTNFKYIQGITNVDSKLDLVWQLKAGVCQDFTNILLQMVRMLGIPARYVSGYICPGDSKTRGEGATHAWIEVYIPFYGWLGLDPTNNLVASEHHVKLAVGRNYKDCAPVNGVYKGHVTDSLYVKVHVSTTKNYNDISVAPTDVEKLKANEKKITTNSYRQNLEFIQQQQQQ